MKQKITILMVILSLAAIFVGTAWAFPQALSLIDQAFQNIPAALRPKKRGRIKLRLF